MKMGIKKIELRTAHLSPYDTDRFATMLREFGYDVVQEDSFKDNPNPRLVITRTKNRQHTQRST